MRIKCSNRVNRAFRFKSKTVTTSEYFRKLFFIYRHDKKSFDKTLKFARTDWRGENRTCENIVLLRKWFTLMRNNNQLFVAGNVCNKENEIYCEFAKNCESRSPRMIYFRNIYFIIIIIWRDLSVRFITQIFAIFLSKYVLFIPGYCTYVDTNIRCILNYL